MDNFKKEIGTELQKFIDSVCISAHNCGINPDDALREISDTLSAILEENTFNDYKKDGDLL